MQKCERIISTTGTDVEESTFLFVLFTRKFLLSTVYIPFVIIIIIIIIVRYGCLLS